MIVVEVVVDVDYFRFDLEIYFEFSSFDCVDDDFEFVWVFFVVDLLVVEIGLVVMMFVELVVVEDELFGFLVVCFFDEFECFCFVVIEVECFLGVEVNRLVG